MKKVSQIPVHRLEQRGKSNFEINKIEHGVIDLNYYNSIDEHRDDYYVFVYQESGTSNITVDFEELNVSGRYIFCVQPGQVHFGNFTQNTSAWVIAVASEWVPAESRFFLMETGISNQPVNINSETEALLFQHILHLLHTFEKRNAAEQILKSMFDVYHQLFIQTYQKTINTQPKKNSRPGQITRQFKSLLLSNYRIMKSPAEYAGSLNITPAYLNEVVKGTTGYPVSHWIHQEIILEAKRELYYTNNTVKEIAYSLGYADTAYFIRLFKKNAGVSPLHFRQKYHK